MAAVVWAYVQLQGPESQVDNRSDWIRVKEEIDPASPRRAWNALSPRAVATPRIHRPCEYVRKASWRHEETVKTLESNALPEQEKLIRKVAGVFSIKGTPIISDNPVH